MIKRLHYDVITVPVYVCDPNVRTALGLLCRTLLAHARRLPRDGGRHALLVRRARHARTRVCKHGHHKIVLMRL